MLTINNKEYRNLEEQVQKNKSDIETLTSINGLLGIKIINQVYSEDDLPDTDSDVFRGMTYGDAYIVVNPDESYSFYVKTRPTTDEPYDHWFELRLEGIEGPVGPMGRPGDRGEQGPIGFKAYATNDINVVPLTDKIEGRTAMLQDGRVYRVLNGQWAYITTIVGAQGIPGQSIKGDPGEQGIQGEKGEKGDPGGFIHIIGTLTSESQLPDTSELGDLTAAYLVGPDSAPKHLWIQVGPDTSTAYWEDEGILNVATYITVDGQYVGMWDADTKVDKITTPNPNYYLLYAVSPAGVQTSIRSTSAAAGNVIPISDPAGRLYTTNPVNANHAANKNYVDTHMPKIIRI